MNKKYSSALAVIISAVALAGTAAAGGGHHGSRAGRMTKLDTNKDGKVTLPELTQSKQSWLAEVDTNKDGAATSAEVDAHVKARHEKRIQELFKQKDANRDGRLSREESAMPERWFERKDENRDGALSPAELASERGKRSEHTDAAGKHGDGKLGHMDLNKDGKVDRAEVGQAAALMLQRLDENADGALSAEELGARGKGRGHRGDKNDRHPANGRGEGKTPERS